MDKIMKNSVKFILIVFVVSLLIPLFLSTSAQYNFEGREEEMLVICRSYDEDSKAECEAFSKYLKAQREESDKKLEEIKGSVNSISGDIKKDEALLTDAVKRIESLRIQIGQSKAEITKLQNEIDKLIVEIKEREAEIEIKHETARNYMVNIQSTTRVNVFIDFLFGADDFAEISRRVEGMNLINEKNQSNIRSLNEEKDKLEENKKDIDFQKKYMSEVLEEQEKTIVYQEELKKFAEERVAVLRKQYQAMLDAKNAAEEERKLTVSKINAIGPVVSSQGGMLRPISSGFVISASVWNYSSGVKHLGIDLAAGIGTSIAAPANGVVIATRDGCPTWGNLSGTNCASSYGNWITMIVSSDNKTYGVLYGHMQQGGVLVGTGQKITKGQVIGRVGSSGMSTGPHVHAELFYLGTDSVEDTYNNWYAVDRTIQFGLGGSSSSREYSNRCDVKGYVPNCRMNPSSYWGLYVGQGG